MYPIIVFLPFACIFFWCEMHTTNIHIHTHHSIDDALFINDMIEIMMDGKINSSETCSAAGGCISKV
jgi:hypothetical protein